MLAAIIEQPGQLRVRDIPQPVCGEYDCLCQMLYGSTCSATDQHMIEGKLPFTINYPTIMGHESVGRVISVGEKVRYFKIGDLISRVGAPATKKVNSNWGGYAEFGLARDHRAMKEDNQPKELWDAYRVNNVIPKGVDPRAACMVITWRETLSFIKRMGVSSGSKVLIIGSGGNGLAFTSHARNLGSDSIALIGSPARKAQGTAAGAGCYLDYRREDLCTELKNYCSSFNFIIDAVGKAGMVNKVLKTLGANGMIGIYGIDDFHSYGINPFYSTSTFSIYNGGYDEEETHDEVTGNILTGKLDASIWLDLKNPYPLSKIQTAMQDVGKRKHVKALIKICD